jgi:DNA replication protein
MPDRQSSSSRSTGDSVPLCDCFFTRVMPGVQDLAELKVILYIWYLSGQKRDRPQPGISGVTYGELQAETARLAAGLDEETLRLALDSAVEHGILLRSKSEVDGERDETYSLTAQLQRSAEQAAVNVFALYEQNIGMLTPMISQELEEAAELYPPGWIEEAFKEAVSLNKRSWRYIARILERWAREGKDSGEHKRDTEKNGPDKYIKGKYGHLVRR